MFKDILVGGLVGEEMLFFRIGFGDQLKAIFDEIGEGDDDHEDGVLEVEEDNCQSSKNSHF